MDQLIRIEEKLDALSEDIKEMREYGFPRCERHEVQIKGLNWYRYGVLGFMLAFVLKEMFSF